MLRIGRNSPLSMSLGVLNIEVLLIICEGIRRFGCTVVSANRQWLMDVAHMAVAIMLLVYGQV